MDEPNKDDLLKVNLYRLEEECINNPRLMREWADKLAKARLTADRAEAKLKLTKAELGKKIRERPEAFGVEKATVDAVTDAVIAHKDHQAALTAKINADYDVDVIKSMVDAIHDRGKQLSNACDLHGQQYWAKPHTDPETRAEIEKSSRVDTMQEVAEALSEARKTRKK